MSKRSNFPAPMVMRPMAEYRSPIDGRLITSKQERREELKRNDCVEWEPGIGKGAYKRTPGEVHNPKYERGGLKLSERGQQRKELMRKGATHAQAVAEERGKR
jgi:hypothetical protein